MKLERVFPELEGGRNVNRHRRRSLVGGGGCLDFDHEVRPGQRLHPHRRPCRNAPVDVSDAARAEAIAHVEARLADYRTDSGVEVPFRSYLASVTA